MLIGSALLRPAESNFEKKLGKIKRVKFHTLKPLPQLCGSACPFRARNNEKRKVNHCHGIHDVGWMRLPPTLPTIHVSGPTPWNHCGRSQLPCILIDKVLARVAKIPAHTLVTVGVGGSQLTPAVIHGSPVAQRAKDVENTNI